MRSTSSNLARHRARAGDERGAILVLAAVGVVLAMIASALAIDLGFAAQEARRNQKVADLAAMDAVRDLANVQPRAEASAARNKFLVTQPGHTVTAVRGTLSGGTFSANAAGTTVEVTVTSPHEDMFPFVSGPSTVTRRGYASMEAKAGFSIGSKLASLNPGDNTLLNRVFTAILGTSPAMNLTLVGYQGLASGTVSLSDLVAADAGLGTPDQLATSTVSVRRLAQASLTALNNKAAGGDTAAAAAATPLGTFASTIDSALTVDMGDIFQFNQPADPAAAYAQVNVLDLLTTSGQAAQIANGNNLLIVPNLTLGIPGLTQSTLRLHLVEAPRFAYGPARFEGGQWVTRAQTAQVGVDLDVRIVVGLCAVLCVDETLPIRLSAAKATGSLTDIRCAGATKQNDILVDTLGANATAAAVITIRTLLLNIAPPPIAANVPVSGGSSTLTFTGPPYPTAIQSTAANGLGLSTLLTSQVVGLVPGLGALVTDVLNLLNPVTSAVDNQILKPLFDSLGLSVGGADVRTLTVDCGSPTLVK